jgi:hypothetical protein
MSSEIKNRILELTHIWLSWNSFHKGSIDSKLNLKRRRDCGEHCGLMLKSRIEVIQDLDAEFERLLNENKGRGN